uniref:Uncharacterized protein n=1 Tax=Trichogramma kaykai TaxID=54128 RepID=A0ABD2WRP9_9HYME
MYPLLLLLLVLFAAVIETIESRSVSDNDSIMDRDWSIVRHFQRSSSLPLVVQLQQLNGTNNASSVVGGSLIHIVDVQDYDDDDDDDDANKHPLRLVLSARGESCSVPLSLGHPLRQSRRAVGLGNGKLVVWLLNYRLTPLEAKHTGEWVFAIVDPADCQAAVSFRMKDTEAQPVEVIDVVPYYDTFDVLLTSLNDTEDDGLEVRYNHAYRFDDAGEPDSTVVNPTMRDIDSRPFYTSDAIRFYSIRPHSPAAGYYYVHVKPATGSAMVRKVGPDFRVLASAHLKPSKYHRFGHDVYSTAYGNFTTCHYIEARAQLNCIFLNDRLRIKRYLAVRNELFGYQFSRRYLFSLINRAEGGAVVLFSVDPLNYRVGVSVFVQLIDADYKLGRQSLIGRIFCNIRELQTFYMGRDSRYCFVAICDDTKGGEDEDHHHHHHRVCEQSSSLLAIVIISRRYHQQEDREQPPNPKQITHFSYALRTTGSCGTVLRGR